MDIKERNIVCQSNFVPHPWERARAEIARTIISKHSSGRLHAVVDIGCGDCFVLSFLAKTFRDCFMAGVDTALDDAARERLNCSFSEQGLKIRLYSSQKAASADLPAPADVVLVMDMLEHVENDAGVLSEISSIFSSDSSTRFLLTVPAFQSLMSSHDRYLGHYRRYDLSQLEACALAAHLQIVESGYVFTGLCAVRWVQTLLERAGLKGGKFTGVAGWKYGDSLSALAAFFLVVEFKIIHLLRKMGITLPGLSVYAICKK